MYGKIKVLAVLMAAIMMASIFPAGAQASPSGAISLPGSEEPSGPLPYIPSNPSPKNGVTDASINPTLSWSGGDANGSNVTYDIYLDAGDNTPDTKIASITSIAKNISYSVNNLQYKTTYYWRINARNGNGGVMGPVWSFTTKEQTVIKIAVYNVSEMEPKYPDKFGSENWEYTGTYGMVAAFSGIYKGVDRSKFTVNGETYPVKVKIVNYKDITNHILTGSNSSVFGGQNFSLFLAPGDNDYWVDQFLYDDMENFKEEIRTFVDNGGGYIGTCGGAAIACKMTHRNFTTGGQTGIFTLGLVDADSYGEKYGNEQYLRSIMYDKGYGDGSGVSDWGGIPVKNKFVDDEYAQEIFDKHKNDTITLTYWGGAWYGNLGPSVIKIAQFGEEPSKNGSLALHWKNGSKVETHIWKKWSIIAANYDNNSDGIAGRVVLFSAHPEHVCWDISKGVHHVIEDLNIGSLEKPTYIYYYNKSGIDAPRYVNSSKEVDYHQIDKPDKDTRDYIRNAAKWILETVTGNHPPSVPSNPSPDDGTTGVSINPTLTWQCSDPDNDTLRYDVYFGTSSSPPKVATVTSSSYNPGTLNYNTTYYWKIIASDGQATTSGPVWQFTTGNNNPPNAPYNPHPSDGATGVSVNPTLTWQCSDPDGDSLEYKISLTEVRSNIVLQSSWFSTNSHTFSNLDYGTTYEWKVIARDVHGATTAGPAWTFTTENQSNHAPYTPSNPTPSNGATITSGSSSTTDSSSTQTIDSGPVSQQQLTQETQLTTQSVTASVDSTATDTSSQSSDSQQAISAYTLKLSWNGGDPDGDTVTYKVYFEGGDSTPDNLIATTTATTIYYSVNLQAGTTYYWKVVADDGQLTTTGAVWHFYVSNDSGGSTSDSSAQQTATV